MCASLAVEPAWDLKTCHDQEVLLILGKRYCVYPVGVKAKRLKDAWHAIHIVGRHYVFCSTLVYYAHVYCLPEDWASAQSTVVRSMAMHGLLLAKRSSGSRTLEPHTLSHNPKLP